MNETASAIESVVPPRLGRSAWLVQLAGLLGGGVVLTAGHFAFPDYSSDRAVSCFGYGASVLVGMTIWAHTLAVRAVLRGESKDLPYKLFFTDQIIFGIYGLYLWFPLWSGSQPSTQDWRYEWFLPVLLPFFALLIFVIFTVVRRVIFVLEKRRARTSQPPLTPAARWRWTAGLAALVSIVMIVVVLPMPAFLLSFMRGNTEVQSAVIKYTPDFYRDLVEDALHRIPAVSTQAKSQHLLDLGLASEQRLWDRTHDSNLLTRSYSLDGLGRRNRNAAVQRAFEIFAFAPTPTVGFVFQRYGDDKDLAKFIELTQDMNQSTSAYGMAYHYLMLAPRDPNLVPVLERCIAESHLNKDLAAMVLLEWYSPERVKEFITSILNGNDKVLRDRLSERFLMRSEIAVWLYHQAMLQDDALFRRRIAVSSYVNGPLAQADGNLLGTDAFNVLGNSDIVERRGAAERAVSLMTANRTIPIELNCTDLVYAGAIPGNATVGVEAGGVPFPESPAETALLKQARQRLKEWLEKRGVHP